MDVEELFTKQMKAIVESRIARAHAAFRELQAALDATRLKPDDFPEARALGIDTSNAQLVMDNELRQYLSPEIFKFIEGYEAARARDAQK